MYAVGHLALGYITGKAASKFVGVKVNVALLFLVSVLPDIDLIIPWLEHRGPTHSLVIYALMFVPAFWVYGKQVVPIFVSLTQHVLVGDLITGEGVQVLWPIISKGYGTQMTIMSTLNISLEWALFLISLGVLWIAGDMMALFHHHPSNLLLTIPVFAIILPTFFSFPLTVPFELVIPHLAFLMLLTFSIVADLKQISKATRQQPDHNAVAMRRH